MNNAIDGGLEDVMFYYWQASRSETMRNYVITICLKEAKPIKGVKFIRVQMIDRSVGNTYCLEIGDIVPYY